MGKGWNVQIANWNTDELFLLLKQVTSFHNKHICLLYYRLGWCELVLIDFCLEIGFPLVLSLSLCCDFYTQVLQAAHEIRV